MNRLYFKIDRNQNIKEIMNILNLAIVYEHYGLEDITRYDNPDDDYQGIEYWYVKDLLDVLLIHDEDDNEIYIEVNDVDECRRLYHILSEKL